MTVFCNTVKINKLVAFKQPYKKNVFLRKFKSCMQVWDSAVEKQEIVIGQ